MMSISSTEAATIDRLTVRNRLLLAPGGRESTRTGICGEAWATFFRSPVTTPLGVRCSQEISPVGKSANTYVPSKSDG